GDCAAVPLAGSPGEYCPQTAQFAMRQGETMAKNIMTTLNGGGLKPFGFKGLGELASIGHQTAVANVMGVKFSGFFAWFMWRTIYLSKLPGWDRRIRVVFEWTLDLFFPRDINLLNPRFSKVYQQVHLEADDRLFSSGEPAFSLYVVKEGKVELRDGDKLVRTVEEGDFFGERALVHETGYLYDAVSPVKTKLLSINGGVIVPFLQASRRLRRVLAKTTAQGSAEGEMSAIKSKLDSAVLDKKVSSVMRTNVATLQSFQTVGDALELFKERRFSIYPLVSEDNLLIGVISREDFFDFLKRDDVSSDTKLDGVDLMHLPICDSGQTVNDALEQMVRLGRYKCLAIDGEKKVVGIVTVMDLLGESVGNLG
ncbi:MAG: CBS domain-containing protein, partial [Verrucomicrobiota bacterium]